MITELTKKQKNQLSIVVDKWIKIQLSTQQYTNEEITDSINKFYKSINKSKPKIIILDSPKQCTQYIKDNNISIRNSIYYSIYYSIRNSIWYAIYIDYGINCLKIKELEQYKPFVNIAEKIYFSVLEDDIVIVCRKLKALHLDETNRLHSDEVKAYEFNDGYGEYFNHGIRIPEQKE